MVPCPCVQFCGLLCNHTALERNMFLFSLIRDIPGPLVCDYPVVSVENGLNQSCLVLVLAR